MGRTYTDSPMQFLLWLRKSKLNKAGTAPVYLRIFLDTDTRSEYATGIRCRPDEWNAAKGRLRGNDEASRAYNKKLKKLQGKAELKADRLQDACDEDPGLPPVMPADVALALRPKKKEPVPAPQRLLDLLRAAIPLYSSKASSRQNAHAMLSFFSKWPLLDTLTLPELTREVATSLVQWAGQQKGAVSSKRHHVGVFAGLLAAAAPNHPLVFSKLTRLLGTPAPTKSTVLPADWQAQLLALRLPRVQAAARDAFLLQYYLHGSRIGVILELRWAHIDYEQGRVRFTTHKYPVAMDMALRPEIREILTRREGHSSTFVLPFLPANYLLVDDDQRHKILRKTENSVGMALKGICAKLGWPRLKSHLARHTLALQSYLKNDKDLRVPQQLLGHKNISTTALYIAGLDTSELDAGAANAYG